MGLIILGTASCIQILKAQKINYIYIFGIDPVNQVTHNQLYKVAMLMFAIVNVLILLQIITLNFNWSFADS